MFAKMLKAERGNMSIDALARAIDIDPSQLRGWENGRLPNRKTLEKLVEVFEWNDHQANLAADLIDMEKYKRKKRRMENERKSV